MLTPQAETHVHGGTCHGLQLSCVVSTPIEWTACEQLYKIRCDHKRGLLRARQSAVVQLARQLQVELLKGAQANFPCGTFACNAQYARHYIASTIPCFHLIICIQSLHQC